jgi:hypothetical protein
VPRFEERRADPGACQNHISGVFTLQRWSQPADLEKRTSAGKQAAENAVFGEESSPQRLKPNSLHSSYVRPEGRTLQKNEFFRSQLSRTTYDPFTARLNLCSSSRYVVIAAMVETKPDLDTSKET